MRCIKVAGVISLLGLSLGLAACAKQVRTVRADGSAGVMPLVAELARAFHQRQSAVAVELGGGLGSRARLQALTEGRIDVALASHGLDPGEIARQGLAIHEIARGAVVFAVHAGVAVQGLTEAQVCGIYGGRIVDWRELGGGDLAIVPHTRPESEVDAEVVVEQIGCWEELKMAPAVRVVADPSDMMRAIADTPGAIGMTSMPLVQQSQGRVRPLALDGRDPSAENLSSGAYRLVRHFFLVARASPSEAVASFLSFVRSPAGEQVIRASGAVPTR